MHDQLVDRRALKTRCGIDEYTRECLAIEVSASLGSQDVILTLLRLLQLYGKPACVRSDNGVEFTAAKVIRRQGDAAIGPAFIAPGSPWQNEFVESFSGKLRDELLNRAWFCSRSEAKVPIERWQRFYNERRPHTLIITNFRPRSVEPGWIPIISTRGSLPDGLQNSTAGHSYDLAHAALQVISIQQTPRSTAREHTSLPLFRETAEWQLGEIRIAEQQIFT